ncbi:MAG: hypothetical protein B7Z08_00125 [Sphingomonadales bacterium 32-68-7]|nr:MAG: hypothetical protein B7Z33_08230 [Sphingomonadales bacterium 12-68-11]OYX10639.1 MAG: hypothetical protein B7Z08_00125 [Sphingomonadales bacterium 32-68-7]
MRPAEAEQGYALLSAVAAIAVFAALALSVLGGVQGGIVQAHAEIERARADAAAEAGINLALQNLLIEDRAFRWSIDGRSRSLQFGDAVLQIRVEDQRGKIPLVALEEEQVGRMLELLGVSGDRLRVATDSLLDWLDDDDEPRGDGAELEFYAARGIHPRNGVPLSIDELAEVRGFDAALVERLGALLTLNFGQGSFEWRHADPIAIAVLSDGAEDAPEAIERARELAGQRVAIELGEADLTGRPLAIVVDAYMPGGGHARQSQIVELTGSAVRPYVIREAD